MYVCYLHLSSSHISQINIYNIRPIFIFISFFPTLLQTTKSFHVPVLNAQDHILGMCLSVGVLWEIISCSY